MKVLLRQHGFNLSGVKSDLYTQLGKNSIFLGLIHGSDSLSFLSPGIDSKHPSGLQSTVWKNTQLMKDSEIKELKEAYFASKPKTEAAVTGIAPSKDPETKPQAASDKKESVEKKTSAKPKLVKKRKQNDDPFASDDEGENAKSTTKKVKA
jgi:hypothetical protein